MKVASTNQRKGHNRCWTGRSGIFTVALGTYVVAATAEPVAREVVRVVDHELNLALLAGNNEGTALLSVQVLLLLHLSVLLNHVVEEGQLVGLDLALDLPQLVQEVADLGTGDQHPLDNLELELLNVAVLQPQDGDQRVEEFLLR